MQKQIIDQHADVLLAVKYVNKADNAKRRKIPFELSLSDFKKLQKQSKCFYTGARLNDLQDDRYKRTLDRKDNSIGYTRENTVVCAKWFNEKKSNLTLEEIKLLSKAL